MQWCSRPPGRALLFRLHLLIVSSRFVVMWQKVDLSSVLEDS